MATAAAVMAEDEDVPVAGQFGKTPGHFPHRHEGAGFNLADPDLVRFPDIEQHDSVGLHLEQVAGILDRDFERDFCRV